MGHKLPECLFEHEAIDIADQSESLDGRDKLCARNKISRLVAHPEQTLEITDFSGLCVHYWLEGEEQTVVAQRCLYHRAYRQASRLPIAECFLSVLIHLPGAPMLSMPLAA
jgi:hypothetical protein